MRWGKMVVEWQLLMLGSETVTTFTYGMTPWRYEGKFLLAQCPVLGGMISVWRGDSCTLKQFRLVNLSAQSVLKKAEQLELMLLNYDPHVTVVTETGLNDHVPNTDVFPPLYKIFCRYRLSCGGGVAIVLQDSINALVLKQIDDHGSLFLRVNCWGNCFVLCTAYMSTSSSADILQRLFNHMLTFAK